MKEKTQHDLFPAKEFLQEFPGTKCPLKQGMFADIGDVWERQKEG